MSGLLAVDTGIVWAVIIIGTLNPITLHRARLRRQNLAFHTRAHCCAFESGWPSGTAGGLDFQRWFSALVIVDGSHHLGASCREARRWALITASRQAIVRECIEL